MDARVKTVREILHSGDQYLIPFFQRHYQWKKKHWKRLFDDVCVLLENADNSSQHFLGPLVCTPTKHIPGDVPSYQLIDGQQRLTTLTLVLCALRDVARQRRFDDLAEEISEDYLVQKRRKGLERYRVIPRIGDREALLAIIDNEDVADHRDSNVVHARNFFTERISDWAYGGAVERLRDVLIAFTERLSLVAITINDENPYEIFESLNSTGLPLEESDLIRNYLFMQVPIAEQDDFNSNHWDAFEKMFDAVADYAPMSPTEFYRSYLMRLGDYSKRHCTFVDFKAQNRHRDLTPVEQVDELKRFAGFEQMLRRPMTCGNPDIANELKQIAMLEVTTVHPLLMNLLDRHKSEQLTRDELLGCLRDVSSFILRRTICGESTRAYGRWFREAAAQLKDNPKQELRGYLMRRGWPDDETFLERLKEFRLYQREPKKCRLLLEQLENSYGHKERVDQSTLTIEHVMPQTISANESGAAWKQMLGEDWSHVHERWLHTLGNLTLTGYNADLSNKAYEIKCEELRRSNLVLNRHFVDISRWDETAIAQRGEMLANELAKFWPRPAGGEYTPVPREKTTSVSTSGKRRAKLEYWTQLLETLKRRGKITSLPNVTRPNRLTFSLGRTSFKVLAYTDSAKSHIGVYLSCRGKNANTHFAQLLNERRAIEDALGEVLQWDELPDHVSSRIALRRPRTDPLDRDDWPRQHEWLAEKLEKFVPYFMSRHATVRGSADDDGTRLATRERFWATLLERAANKTNLHGNISPRDDSWIGTSAGVPGLLYLYDIMKTSGRVELYIDRGKGSKSWNKQLFDRLFSKKEQIEQAFGAPLLWNRIDEKRACRIAHLIAIGGYRSDEASWPDQQDEMIDAMIRLAAALNEHLPNQK